MADDPYLRDPDPPTPGATELVEASHSDEFDGDLPNLEGVILKGKYRIEQLLGRGGMGSVWAAVHELTGRKLAVKVLAHRYVGQKTIVERFGREARAASAIKHPGIVEILDLDRTEAGVPFLVMERLSGETLAERLDRRERLLAKDVSAICEQLLEALDAAHAHGVVHRDLKPENIVILRRSGGGETIKILDFGISAKEDERVSELTMVGSVLGTPHYMAPEQALGQTDIDGRADLYALGVVAYECLTGAVPFDAPNYNRLLQVILSMPPPPFGPGVPKVPEALERFVMALLEKDPSARPQTAAAALSLLLGRPAAARPRTLPKAVSDLALPGPRNRDRGGAAAPPLDETVATEFLDFPTEGRSAADESAPRFRDTGGESTADGFAVLELDENALARATRPTPAPRDVGAVSANDRADESARLSRATGAGRFSKAGIPPSATSDVTEPASERSSRTGKRWIFALALAGIAVAVLLFQFRKAFPGDDPSAAAPLTSDAPVVERPASAMTERVDTVSVSLRNLPPGATLSLDGIPVGSPPLRVRRSSDAHALEVRAPGYESRIIRFTPTTSLTISASLRPEGSRRSHTARP